MTPEAMFKLGCKTSATEAYVLSFNKEKDMLLLEEKEVMVFKNLITIKYELQGVFFFVFFVLLLFF